MHPQTEYLVVIKPAPIKAPVGVGVSGYTITNGPGIRTKTVMADNAEKAAEAAGIKGGETAYVIAMEHIQTFERPELAPLVQAA